MNIKSIKQSNKGFTLAEICVTFVIISVLASITTFSLIAWQHESQFNKAERNAELIYMALKNKIVIYKANDIEFAVVDDYLCCSATEYEQYKNNKKNPNVDQQKPWLLFDLVGEYIYDKTILNAYIYVYFDDDGNIQSVYYSDRTDFYNSSGIKNEYKNDSKRYEDLVGAYLLN